MTVTYKFTVKQTIYSHDHKELSDLNQACTPYANGVTAGNFKIATLDSDDSSSKKGGNTVEFSGEVKLPAQSDKSEKMGGGGAK